MGLEGKGTTAARDLCWNCQSNAAGEYFCESCIKIQPLSRDADYFSCLGLPRRLNIDSEDLERRFYELSRKSHPDFYQQKSEQEKVISLENSAMLNTAYRILRDPIQRVEYLIRLKEGAAKAIPSHPPSDLLEEILELQEVLEEYKQIKQDPGSEQQKLKENLEAEVVRLEVRKKSLENDLFSLFDSWDRLQGGTREEEEVRVLRNMKGIIGDRAYLETVLRDIHEGLA